MIMIKTSLFQNSIVQNKRWQHYFEMQIILNVQLGTISHVRIHLQNYSKKSILG